MNIRLTRIIILLVLFGFIFAANAGAAESCYIKKDTHAHNFTRCLNKAKTGDADAQHKLGNAYHKGEGVKKSYIKAEKWYRKAAIQGHARAQYNLGNAYSFGRGVNQNYTESSKWFKKAAEQGVDFAQFNLGNAYYEGRGVKKDITEAEKWYRESAEQGFYLAQYYLAILYRRGEGVKKSDAEAVKWYIKAAEQGYELAQYQLGLAYAKGRGVKKNDTEAAKWYKKAAEKGNKFAQRKICAAKLEPISVISGMWNKSKVIDELNNTASISSYKTAIPYILHKRDYPKVSDAFDRRVNKDIKNWQPKFNSDWKETVILLQENCLFDIADNMVIEAGYKFKKEVLYIIGDTEYSSKLNKNIIDVFSLIPAQKITAYHNNKIKEAKRKRLEKIAKAKRLAKEKKERELAAEKERNPGPSACFKVTGITQGTAEIISTRINVSIYSISYLSASPYREGSMFDCQFSFDTPKGVKRCSGRVIKADDGTYLAKSYCF